MSEIKGKVYMGRRTILGVLIILVGMGFLLQQTGLLHLTAPWLTGPVVWPWLLVLLGLLNLKEFRRGRIPWGALFFIVLGVGLSIKAAGLLPVWIEQVNDWSLFWSLVLIFVGLSFIFPQRWGKAWWPIRIEMSHHHQRHKQTMDGEDFFDINETSRQTDSMGYDEKQERKRKTPWSAKDRSWRVVHRWIGDLSVGRQPWVLRNLDLWNGIGDVRVNLATAHVEEGSYEVTIRGLIGDVRVLIPETLPVFIAAEVGIGDIEVLGEKHSGMQRSVTVKDPDYDLATRQCHITIALRIGDVEIIRV